MKIFVQNPSTKLYLGKDGEWTPSIGTSHDFESPADALDTCRQYRLKDYQLILRFRQPNFEMTVSQQDAEKMINPPLLMRDSHGILDRTGS